MKTISKPVLGVLGLVPRGLLLLATIVLLGLPTIAYWFLTRFLLPKEAAAEQVSPSTYSPVQTPEPVPSEDDEYFDRLAKRFCPCLLLFPENHARKPPSEQDQKAPDLARSADYHPRSVKLFLDLASLRRWPMTWLPFVSIRAGRQPTTSERIRQELWKHRRTWMRSPRSSLEIPGLHRYDFRYRMAHDLEGLLRLVELTRKIAGGASRCGCQREAWNKYFKAIDQVPPGRPMTGEQQGEYPFETYVHVVEGDLPAEEGQPRFKSLALEYWWFYFYNDFTNRHQADWEGITVILREDATSEWPVPIGAAYFNHNDGRWRLWEHLQRAGTEETHPVVYVARGSHASYFAPVKHGHKPSVRFFIHLDSLGVHMSHRISMEQPDWVPDARLKGDNISKVYPDPKVIPSKVEAPASADEIDSKTWNEWWWLFYGGTWGARAFLPLAGSSGVDGPMFQGDKWSDPWKWIVEECVAELPEDKDPLLQRPSSSEARTPGNDESPQEGSNNGTRL